jgi:hypothetical protein
MFRFEVDGNLQVRNGVNLSDPCDRALAVFLKIGLKRPEKFITDFVAHSATMRTVTVPGFKPVFEGWFSGANDVKVWWFIDYGEAHGKIS